MNNQELDNFYQELVQESHKITTYQKIKDTVLDFVGYHRDFYGSNESEEEIQRKERWNFFLISSTGIFNDASFSNWIILFRKRY